MLKWALILCLLFPYVSKASHVVGAELGYTCLGDSTYEIELVLYRDCGGINAPGSVAIEFFSSCDTLLLVAGYDPGAVYQVPPLYPIPTTCDSGIVIGIEKYTYRDTIVLPPCDDWLMRYTVCCRNNVTTIQDPGATTLQVIATLNNKDTCNSSPAFKADPVPYLCLGESMCFDHGAQDADGDSLYYSLVAPLQMGGEVLYNIPYNEVSPISAAFMSFNFFTGEFCVIPTAIQVGTMAIRIEQWRNGVLVGTTMRDIELIIIDCSSFALPVTWGDVSAEYDELMDAVKIRWQTHSERNCDYYEIAEGNDGWLSIGRVMGHGTTSQAHNYEFIDTTPVQHYIIKQVDYDGGFSYSEILVVPSRDKRGKCYYITIQGQPVGDDIKKLPPGIYIKRCREKAYLVPVLD